MCDEPRPRKRHPQLGQGRADPTRNRPALVIDGSAAARRPIAAGQNHSVAWHPRPAPPAPGAAAAAAAAAAEAAAAGRRRSSCRRRSAPPSPASPARAPSSPASLVTPPGLPPSSVYSVFGSHKYGRLAHEREVDAAHPQPVDVTGWVEAQSAVESASETHGDAISRAAVVAHQNACKFQPAEPIARPRRVGAPAFRPGSEKFDTRLRTL